MKKKLLLIGAGPTASLIAYNIAKCERLNKIIDIEVWEKSKEIGGKFATTQIDKNFETNFGAQYLTSSNNWSSSYFDNLARTGLISPLDTSKIPGFNEIRNKKHFVCTKGTGSLVDHYFKQGGVVKNLNLRLSTKVSEMKCQESKILVESDTERREEFDVVISTIPAPLLIQLQNFNKLVKGDNDLKLNLALVDYTSRFALGLFYDKVPNETVVNDEGTSPFTFIVDEGDIRFWSIKNASIEDNEKRFCIIGHSSTQFGAQHLDDKIEDVQQILLPNLLQRVEKVMGKAKPSIVHCHKWEKSQVKRGYPYEPGFVEISQDPLILAAGDSFTYSSFEGCILSAEKTTERIRLLLT